MRYSTHISTGILAGIVLYGPNPNAIILTGIGAVVPDIDSPYSFINKPFTHAKPKRNGILRHRGIMHTIWPPLLIWGAYYYFFGNNYIFPFVIGYILHLIFDAMTPSGIKPFYPILPFKVKGKIRTGSWVDHTFGGICLAAFLCIALRLIFLQSFK